MDCKNIIGKMVSVTVDRPMNTVHPKHKNIIYPINYGYVDGIMGGDGEEQDVYLLGLDQPVDSCEAVIIAVIHRLDDNEDKWVATPNGERLAKEEIMEAVAFQEQYFKSEIYM